MSSCYYICVLILYYIGTTQPSRQAGGGEVEAENYIKYVFSYYYVGTYICVLILYYIGTTQPSRQAGGAEVEAEDSLCGVENVGDVGARAAVLQL